MCHFPIGSPYYYKRHITPHDPGRIYNLQSINNNFLQNFCNIKQELCTSRAPIDLDSYQNHSYASFARIPKSNILTSRLSSFTIPSSPSTPINLPLRPRNWPPTILILSDFLGTTISISLGRRVTVSPLPLGPRATRQEPSWFKKKMVEISISIVQLKK